MRVLLFSNIIMGMFTRGIISKAKRTILANIFFVMVLFTKVHGETMRKTEKVFSITRMEIIMREKW